MTGMVVVAALLAGWLVMRGLESADQDAQELEQQANGNLLALAALVVLVLVGVVLVGIGL